MKNAALILVGFIVLLSVCACAVDPREMQWAEYVCEANDGLDKLMIWPSNSMEAYCNNGAKFIGDR